MARGKGRNVIYARVATPRRARRRPPQPAPVRPAAPAPESDGEAETPTEGGSTVRVGRAAEVWRPAEGEALEGVVVDPVATALSITGQEMAALALHQDGREALVYVLAHSWSSLEAELARVAPATGDRLRIARLADDAEGRRRYRVERA